MDSDRLDLLNATKDNGGSRGPCPHCAESILKTARICPHCKLEVLHDVFLVERIGGAREVYLAARRLAEELDRPEDLNELRNRLTGTHRLLASSVSLSEAEEFLGHLEAVGIHGVSILLSRGPGHRAIQFSPAKRKRKWVWPVLILVIFVFGLTWLIRTREIGLPGVRRGKEISPQEIADRVVGSTVLLSCENQLGTGFFIGPTVILTNSHVICDSSPMIDVAFESGRKTEGKCVRRDTWLDYAVVEVGKQDVEPIPVGDATTLRRGDRVFFAGNPKGLGFSFAEGIVSHPSRLDKGVCFLQVDGAVNHGNSGGPLLDTQGEVVGLVTMVVGEGSNLGLIVPINYLSSEQYFRRWPEIRALRTSSWLSILGEADKENRRQIREFKEKAKDVTVVGAEFVGRSVVEALLYQWASKRPSPGEFGFVFKKDGEVLCHPSGAAHLWLELGLDEDIKRFDPRTALWLKKNYVNLRFFIARAPLVMNGCPSPQEMSQSELSLDPLYLGEAN